MNALVNVPVKALMNALVNVLTQCPKECSRYIFLNVLVNNHEFIEGSTECSP